MRIRVMGLLRGTLRRDPLRHARTDTTPLTPTPVPPTATMDLAGFPVDCSSALGHGAGADEVIMGAGVTTEAATTVAEALPDVDTTEAGRPTPVAEAIAAESVTNTPGGARAYGGGTRAYGGGRAYSGGARSFSGGRAYGGGGRSSGGRGNAYSGGGHSFGGGGHAFGGGGHGGGGHGGGHR